MLNQSRFRRHVESRANEGKTQKNYCFHERPNRKFQMRKEDFWIFVRFICKAENLTNKTALLEQEEQKNSFDGATGKTQQLYLRFKRQ